MGDAQDAGDRVHLSGMLGFANRCDSHVAGHWREVKVN